MFCCWIFHPLHLLPKGRKGTQLQKLKQTITHTVCLPVRSFAFMPALAINLMGWLKRGKNKDWKIQLGDVCGNLLPYGFGQ